MKIFSDNLSRTLVFATSCACVYASKNVKEINNKAFAITASALAAISVYLLSSIDWVNVALFLRPHWHEVGYALQGIMLIYLVYTLVRKIWSHYYPSQPVCSSEQIGTSNSTSSNQPQPKPSSTTPDESSNNWIPSTPSRLPSTNASIIKGQNPLDTPTSEVLEKQYSVDIMLKKKSDSKTGQPESQINSSTGSNLAFSSSDDEDKN